MMQLHERRLSRVSLAIVLFCMFVAYLLHCAKVGSRSFVLGQERYGGRGVCGLRRQAMCGVLTAERIGRVHQEGFSVGLFVVVCLVGISWLLVHHWTLLLRLQCVDVALCWSEISLIGWLILVFGLISWVLSAFGQGCWMWVLVRWVWDPDICYYGCSLDLLVSMVAGCLDFVCIGGLWDWARFLGLQS